MRTSSDEAFDKLLVAIDVLDALRIKSILAIHVLRWVTRG